MSLCSNVMIKYAVAGSPIVLSIASTALFMTHTLKTREAADAIFECATALKDYEKKPLLQTQEGKNVAAASSNYVACRQLVEDVKSGNNLVSLAVGFSFLAPVIPPAAFMFRKILALCCSGSGHQKRM
jgi:hypothetical protein